MFCLLQCNDLGVFTLFGVAYGICFWNGSSLLVFLPETGASSASGGHHCEGPALEQHVGFAKPGSIGHFEHLGKHSWLLQVPHRYMDSSGSSTWRSSNSNTVCNVTGQHFAPDSTCRADWHTTAGAQRDGSNPSCIYVESCTENGGHGRSRSFCGLSSCTSDCGYRWICIQIQC